MYEHSEGYRHVMEIIWMANGVYSFNSLVINISALISLKILGAKSFDHNCTIKIYEHSTIISQSYLFCDLLPCGLLLSQINWSQLCCKNLWMFYSNISKLPFLWPTSLWITAPHPLSFLHWVSHALILSDCDLHCVELNINDWIQRTRCNFNININILSFLIFFIELISWQQRSISYLSSIFRWQFHIDVHTHFLSEIVFRTNLHPTSTSSSQHVSVPPFLTDTHSHLSYPRLFPCFSCHPIQD